MLGIRNTKAASDRGGFGFCDASAILSRRCEPPAVIAREEQRAQNWLQERHGRATLAERSRQGNTGWSSFICNSGEPGESRYTNGVVQSPLRDWQDRQDQVSHALLSGYQPSEFC